jgi:integrase
MASAHKFKDQRGVDNLKPTDAGYEASYAKFRKLRVLVRPSGSKVYILRHRVLGKQEKVTGSDASITKLKDAEAWARTILVKADCGVSVNVEKRAERERARLARVGTLKAVTEAYLKHLEDEDPDKRLRTIDQRRKFLERLVLPVLGPRPIDQIPRSEIMRLLDGIKKKNGARTSGAVFSALSCVFGWHAVRTDSFVSPIVKGMAPESNPARARVLSDDELKRVWDHAGDAGLFGIYVRLLILTCARRAELSKLQWSELDGNDWILPASKSKTRKELVRPLSRAARALLDQVDPVEGSRFTFTTDGAAPINGFGWWKARLDKASGVTGWTLHDLRRTGRSLLARAGVNNEHARQCLGHTTKGIDGTYNRYEYYGEKKHAFDALAGLVVRVVDPQSNVTALRG